MTSTTPAPRYSLKLFIVGQTRRSLAALDNLLRICEQSLAGDYVLEVVDVLEQPEEAERLHVIATPTLIRTTPPPMRRVVGDLSVTEKVLLALGLEAQEVIE
jgi:circadian clock protein KaiB